MMRPPTRNSNEESEKWVRGPDAVRPDATERALRQAHGRHVQPHDRLAHCETHRVRPVRDVGCSVEGSPLTMIACVARMSSMDVKC